MADGPRPTRVMVVVGSVRAGSHTAAAARHVAARTKDLGHQAFVLDPARRPLPLADPEYHDDPGAHPDPNVRALVTAARLADAFVLASPVYHNSYSAVLKNVLDHLTIEHFHYKPVGLLAHGPKLTAVGVCDHLRVVVRGLYGLCVPEQAVTTPQDFTADADGTPVLTGAAMRQRLDGLVTAVLKAARR